MIWSQADHMQPMGGEKASVFAVCIQLYLWTYADNTISKQQQLPGVPTFTWQEFSRILGKKCRYHFSLNTYSKFNFTTLNLRRFVIFGTPCTTNTTPLRRENSILFLKRHHIGVWCNWDAISSKVMRCPIMCSHSST